jgi:hypothetical protein
MLKLKQATSFSMKTLIQYFSLVLVTSILATQTYHGYSQATNATQPDAVAINIKNADWSKLSGTDMLSILKASDPSQIPTKAWEFILDKADWSQIPTNVQEYFYEKVDWTTIPEKVWAKYIHPGVWPDGPKKHMALAHCAEVLLMSVDTNRLNLLLEKLTTNQPAVYQVSTGLNKDGSKAVILVSSNDVIQLYKHFTTQLSSTLNTFAGYLTSPKLKTYTADIGYAAEIVDPNHTRTTNYIGFLSEDGPISDFNNVYIDKNGRQVMSATFNNNGKLRSVLFKLLTIPFYPSSTRQVRASFENGHIIISADYDFYLNYRPSDQGGQAGKIRVDIDFDESGNVHVGCNYIIPHLIHAPGK